eukprot:COSAG01_NODE_19045_length_1034_cov_2.134759_1_plen_135_part_00
MGGEGVGVRRRWGEKALGALQVSTVAVEVSEAVDADAVERWLAELLWEEEEEEEEGEGEAGSAAATGPMEIFRLKGVLSVEGCDDKCVIDRAPLISPACLPACLAGALCLPARCPRSRPRWAAAVCCCCCCCCP